MQKQEPPVFFGEKQAASYDQGNAKFAPVNAALHFLIRSVLSDLPPDARILCVGVGTGIELLYLAQAFPQWQFTAVEPAPAMLDLCRQRAKENGIASRTTFYEGYLDSLPTADLFDAATCLFVSHFLMELEDLNSLFSQIASRLRPNGYFINAALASDQSTAHYENLLEGWLRTLKSFGTPAQHIEQLPKLFRQDVAIRPLLEIESAMILSGFNTPVLFFQMLLMHAWYAQRVST